MAIMRLIRASRRAATSFSLNSSEDLPMTSDSAPLAEKEKSDEHALSIGKIAIAWNLLHENLAVLFAQFFEKNDYGLALSSWHSLVNDAAQREMLRSVSEVKLGKKSKGYGEINWVLEQIKQQVTIQRNTGIHMPLMTYTDLTNSNSEPQILPLHIYGNRRANAMQGADLLKEYGHYEQQIKKLNTYVVAISYNLSNVRNGPESWPGRPQLQPHAPK
jgi:hypothetical protein